MSARFVASQVKSHFYPTIAFALYSLLSNIENGALLQSCWHEVGECPSRRLQPSPSASGGRRATDVCTSTALTDAGMLDCGPEHVTVSRCGMSWSAYFAPMGVSCMHMHFYILDARAARRVLSLCQTDTEQRTHLAKPGGSILGMSTPMVARCQGSLVSSCERRKS